MTTKLQEAVKEAEKLPASDQDRIAEDLLERVKQMRDTFDQAFTRRSEERFASDWDKDAAYDREEREEAAPYSSLDALLNAKLSGPSDASVTYEDVLYSIPKDD